VFLPFAFIFLFPTSSVLFFLFIILSIFISLFIPSYFSSALSFVFYFLHSILDFLFLFFVFWNKDIQSEILTLSPRK
jgi:hypothetical protein